MTPEIEAFIRENIKLGHLPDDQAKIVLDLCLQFPTIWATSETDVGRIRFYSHKIELTKMPIPDKRRFFNRAKQLEAEKCLQEMLDAGILEPSISPMASNIHIVLKPNGKSRVCLDSRRINACTIEQHCSLNTTEHLLARLASKPFRTSLDIRMGYYNIPLAKECRYLTAFYHPSKNQLLHFRSMAMGLKNSTSSFLIVMDHLFSDIEGLIYYIDDLVCTSDTFEEHVSTLRIIFSRLSTATMKIAPNKTAFLKSSIMFLGFDITGNRVTINQAKAQAIRDMRPPKSRKECIKILATWSYFRKFIKAYSHQIKEMQKLISPKITFAWNDKAQKEFDHVKQMFEDNIALYLPTPNGLFHLSIDASLIGRAAVLEQTDDSGTKRLVACSSKCWTVPQSKMPIWELESVALVVGISTYAFYLKCLAEFFVYSDSRAVLFIKRASLINEKFYRLCLELLEYNFSIIHILSSRNIAADCFSRQLEEAGVYTDEIKLSKHELSHVLSKLMIEAGTLIPTAAIRNFLSVDQFKCSQPIKIERYKATASDSLHILQDLSAQEKDKLQNLSNIVEKIQIPENTVISAANIELLLNSVEEQHEFFDSIAVNPNTVRNTNTKWDKTSESFSLQDDLQHDISVFLTETSEGELSSFLPPTSATFPSTAKVVDDDENITTLNRESHSSRVSEADAANAKSTKEANENASAERNTSSVEEIKFSLDRTTKQDILVAASLQNGFMTTDEFINLQNDDPFCIVKKQALADDDPSAVKQFKIAKGILLKFDLRDNLVHNLDDSDPTENRNTLLIRVVLPQVLIEPLVNTVHKQAHMSRSRVLQTIQRKYYAPNLAEIATDILKRCKTCQLTAHTSIARPPMGIQRAPQYPRLAIAMDLAINLNPTPRGNRHCLLITCLFSRFSIACALKNKESTSILKAFREQWLTFAGIPSLALSDGELGIQHGIFHEFCQQYGIKQACSLPYNPQSDGQAESVVKNFKVALRSFCMEHDVMNNWDTHLWLFSNAFNSLISRAHSLSPEEVMYGYQTPKYHLDPVLLETNLGKIQKDGDTEIYRHCMNALRVHVTEARDKQRAINKAQADPNKPPHVFNKGDLVLKKRLAKTLSPGVGLGLASKYTGVYIITKMLDYYANICHVVTGEKFKSHIRYLKPYYVDRDNLYLPPEWDKAVNQQIAPVIRNSPRIQALKEAENISTDITYPIVPYKAATSANSDKLANISTISDIKLAQTPKIVLRDVMKDPSAHNIQPETSSHSAQASDEKSDSRISPPEKVAKNKATKNKSREANIATSRARRSTPAKISFGGDPNGERTGETPVAEDSSSVGAGAGGPSSSLSAAMPAVLVQARAAGAPRLKQVTRKAAKLAGASH